MVLLTRKHTISRQYNNVVIIAYSTHCYTPAKQCYSRLNPFPPPILFNPLTSQTTCVLGMKPWERVSSSRGSDELRLLLFLQHYILDLQIFLNENHSEDRDQSTWTITTILLPLILLLPRLLFWPRGCPCLPPL